MRNIFILCLFLNTFFVSANESQTEKEVNHLLLNSYYNSITQLGEAESTCSGKLAPVLPIDLFKDITLTKNELSKILSYSYLQQSLDCTKSAMYEYFRNATLLRLRGNSDKITKMVVASDKLLSISYGLYLESKVEYMKLSPELRKMVEQLPELQRPFEPMLSSELLEKNFENN